LQAEFESLPESCSDRTTTACDLPCNRPKNRYPDIKSYDQTRVRLAPVEAGLEKNPPKKTHPKNPT
jgi:protein-tyrosine phosphatase